MILSAIRCYFYRYTVNLWHIAFVLSIYNEMVDKKIIFINVVSVVDFMLTSIELKFKCNI